MRSRIVLPPLFPLPLPFLLKSLCPSIFFALWNPFRVKLRQNLPCPVCLPLFPTSPFDGTFSLRPTSLVAIAGSDRWPSPPRSRGEWCAFVLIKKVLSSVRNFPSPYPPSCPLPRTTLSSTPPIVRPHAPPRELFFCRLKTFPPIRNRFFSRSPCPPKLPSPLNPTRMVLGKNLTAVFIVYVYTFTNFLPEWVPQCPPNISA